MMESWDHCCSATNPCVFVVHFAGLCPSPGMLPGDNVLSQDTLPASSTSVSVPAVF